MLVRNGFWVTAGIDSDGKEDRMPETVRDTKIVELLNEAYGKELQLTAALELRPGRVVVVMNPVIRLDLTLQAALRLLDLRLHLLRLGPLGRDRGCGSNA